MSRVANLLPRTRLEETDIYLNSPTALTSRSPRRSAVKRARRTWLRRRDSGGKISGRGQAGLQGPANKTKNKAPNRERGIAADGTRTAPFHQRWGPSPLILGRRHCKALIIESARAPVPERQAHTASGARNEECSCAPNVRHERRAQRRRPLGTSARVGKVRVSRPQRLPSRGFAEAGTRRQRTMPDEGWNQHGPTRLWRNHLACRCAAWKPDC